MWGEGKKTILPSFKELTGYSGSVISAVDLVKGIGKCAKLNVIDVPGATGYLDTNYKGKVDASVKSLLNNQFLMLHIEAPDETGHEGDIKKKIKSIGTEQALDKIKRQKSAYENYFIQIEQKQREDLIRKHTQTYDLKDFIISSIESIIYALENIDTDGTDGDF